MDNTEIFLNFWRHYNWPQTNPVFFRLYHDSQGWPIAYSQEDLAHDFIDITPEQWVRADFRVRVVDGKIVPQEPPLPPKLRPSARGISCHADDVTVITDVEPCQAWSMKSHED